MVLVLTPRGFKIHVVMVLTPHVFKIHVLVSSLGFKIHGDGFNSSWF